MKRAQILASIAATLSVLPFSLSQCSSPPTQDIETVSCQQFLDLPPDEQAEAADKASDVDKLVSYSPAGARLVTPLEYLELNCTLKPPFYEIEYLLSVGDTPTCDGFLAAPPEVRREWAELRRFDEDGASPWDDDALLDRLTKACIEGITLDAAMNFAEAGIHPPSELLEAPELPHAIKWTTTSKLGNVVGGVLQIADVVQTGAPPWGEPEETEIAAAERCAYDPATDAIISGRIAATNRSQKAAQVSVGFRITRSGAGDTTVAIYSGNFCSTESDAATVGLHIDSGIVDRIAPGATYPIYFSIILHDYFSPSHPSGALNELGNYTLTPRPSYSNDDDPIVGDPQDVSMSLSLLDTAA